MHQVWGGGAGEKKRLQYFEFGLPYLVQPLGVNPTYSTFKQTHFNHMFSPIQYLTLWYVPFWLLSERLPVVNGLPVSEWTLRLQRPANLHPYWAFNPTPSTGFKAWPNDLFANVGSTTADRARSISRDKVSDIHCVVTSFPLYSSAWGATEGATQAERSTWNWKKHK